MNISKALKLITIRDRQDIKEIYKEGIKVSTSVGPVFFYLNEKVRNNQAGVFVKKKSGPAYRRNYIKRIIKHFIIENPILFREHNQILFIYKSNIQINYHSLSKIYRESLPKVFANSKKEVLKRNG